MVLPSVFTGSLAVGALQATLERHLATFSLDPVQVRTVTSVGNFGGVNLFGKSGRSYTTYTELL